MLLKLFLVCVLSALVVAAKSSGGVTFKNVAVKGYSLFTFKFNITIANDNSLKNHLPKVVFDQIEIKDSEIPVLYKNSIADIDNLDELLLENDGILEIQPGAFKNVPLLRKLTIKKNKIEEIKEGVFNDLNVGTLDLSDNGIINIDSGAFDNMKELLNINLADNKLSIWDKDWFVNTPLLTRVSFQNNLIEEIPRGAFKNFQGEKRFGSLPLTINIILSHNKIKEISKQALQGLTKINNLWLDNNELESFDDDLLDDVITLKELRIDGNKLKCLSGDLKKIIKAEITHVDGNPWDCDCLNFVKKWASGNNKNLQSFYAGLTCDADRIRKKVDSLNSLLRELKQNRTAEKETRDVEEVDLDNLK